MGGILVSKRFYCKGGGGGIKSNVEMINKNEPEYELIFLIKAQTCL